MANPMNLTFASVFRIAKFEIPAVAVYPIFVFGVLVYLFSVISNLTILVLIITQRSLHRPMFYILFSLPLNDLIGITATFPRVLIDIVIKRHTVNYSLCVFQAFLVHMYGGGIPFILAAMAFDRYFAICKPLRYNSIMRPVVVASVISVAWGMDFVLIFVLFLLQTRVKLCRNYIMSVFCDNFSLLSNSCGYVPVINNMYGLFITVFMHVFTLCVQLFSYIHILVACVSNKQSDARSKALNTCLAQILAFFLFELVGFFTIMSYRSTHVTANVRNVFGLMIFLILPVVNPILYGIKTKDIRTAFVKVMKKGIVSTS